MTTPVSILSQDDTDAILDTAAAWRAEGRAAALATVVTTWGSSPRPVGSQLIADNTGAFAGSVSGGCVESAVIAEARSILKGAPPRLLEFGVSDEQAWEVGLACGGKVQIFVQSLAGRDAVLAGLRRVRASRKPALVAIDLDDGRSALIAEGEDAGDAVLRAAVAGDAARALAEERSRVVERDGRRCFLHVFTPPRRLALVGAVHVAQALIPMAVAAGYEVTVIDPRSAFAAQSRFPGVAMMTQWPGTALAAFGLDRRSALVSLTHDPKIDDPALASALRSDAFYIGALGSRKTHAARLGRLREQGFGDAELARIHAPVGLPIGAVSPAEIAVSILAELTQSVRGAPPLAPVPQEAK
ncbi:MAG: XdhC family protein [Betaproteobacteria bacterium]|nr:XdhC family protein [Betaproteobacteria bacterium]